MTFLQDLRHALHSLLRAPTFTLVALLTLGLAFSSSAARITASLETQMSGTVPAALLAFLIPALRRPPAAIGTPEGGVRPNAHHPDQERTQAQLC